MFLDQAKKLLITFILFMHFLYAEKEQGFSLMENHRKPFFKTSSQDVYYLSSIIFYEKNNWVIWLNEEKKTSSQDMNLPFHITVFSDYILLHIKNNGNTKDIKLFPNQTINLKDYNTYNGDYREKLEQQKENIPITEGEDFDF